MTHSEHVNKLFNNILMLDSDLLIKMCIRENSGGTSVCVIGIAGFMLHPGLFGSFLRVCECRGGGVALRRLPVESHRVCVCSYLLCIVLVSSVSSHEVLWSLFPA